MGADLFGSFAESTCAALVIAAAAVEGSDNTLSVAGWDAMLFPVAISAATHLSKKASRKPGRRGKTQGMERTRAWVDW